MGRGRLRGWPLRRLYGAASPEDNFVALNTAKETYESAHILINNLQRVALAIVRSLANPPRTKFLALKFIFQHLLLCSRSIHHGKPYLPALQRTAAKYSGDTIRSSIS